VGVSVAAAWRRRLGGFLAHGLHWCDGCFDRLSTGFHGFTFGELRFG